MYMNMYIHIHIDMYILKFMCIHIHIYIYTSAFKHIYISYKYLCSISSLPGPSRGELKIESLKKVGPTPVKEGGN
jgi:hypothetical protein